MRRVLLTAALTMTTVVAGCGKADDGTATDPASSSASAPEPTTASPSSPTPTTTTGTPTAPTTTATATPDPTNTFFATGSPITLAGPVATYADRSGDARPAVDITEAAYSNTGRWATARLTVPGLQWRGRVDLGLHRGNDEAGVMQINLTARSDHTTKVVVGAMSRSGDLPVPCRADISTRWDVGQGEVLIQVPWACIPPQEEPTVAFEVSTLLAPLYDRPGPHARRDFLRTDNPVTDAAYVDHTP